MEKMKKYFDDDFTPEEMEAFEEKMCGPLEPRRLTKEEIEQLKKEGRI